MLWHQGSEVRLGKLVEDHRKAIVQTLLSNNPSLIRVLHIFLISSPLPLTACLPGLSPTSSTVAPDDSWNNHPSDLTTCSPCRTYLRSLPGQGYWAIAKTLETDTTAANIKPDELKLLESRASTCGRPCAWLPPTTPAQQNQPSSFCGGQATSEPTDEESAAGRRLSERCPQDESPQATAGINMLATDEDIGPPAETFLTRKKTTRNAQASWGRANTVALVSSVQGKQQEYMTAIPKPLAHTKWNNVDRPNVGQCSLSRVLSRTG